MSLNHVLAPSKMLRRAAAIALGLCLAGAAQVEAHAQAAPSICGDLAAAQGPYDYRTERYWVDFIGRNHFPPYVEALIRGKSSYIGGDIDFVLRHIPNHHRALLAMTRLSERGRWTRPAGASYDIDCYFDRAVRFRADDVIVRMLYASYLGKRSRRPEALRQLDIAVTYATDNPFSHFNIGLHYFDLDAFDKAADQARKARAMGFTRPELVDRLRAKGRWQEPPPEADASGGVAASAPQPASAPR
jgi:hypothetical protein